MNKGVTIGTFDGVHRGHQLVLDVLKQESESRGLQPLAITFDRHPLELIAPSRAPGNLMTTERKVQLIGECGVPALVLPFTDTLRRMTSYEWLDHIHRKFGVDLVAVGYDNTFGSDGVDLGIADYMAMGETIGIDIVRAPEVAGVSSSDVRKAVKAGDIASAANLLGHYPELEGKVTAGFHMGARLGFPTANLQVSPRLVAPAGGVYAALAYVGKEKDPVPAMVNIGMRPTFEGTDTASLYPTIEAHLIDAEMDLYGKEVRLEFVSKLRDEMRFKSTDDLKSQLEADRLATISLLREQEREQAWPREPREPLSPWREL